MKIKLVISMIAILAILVACSAPDETPVDGNDMPSDSDSQLVVYGVAGNITELTSNDNGTMTILVEGDLATNGADYDRGYVTVNDDTVIYLDEEGGHGSLRRRTICECLLPRRCHGIISYSGNGQTNQHYTGRSDR